MMTTATTLLALVPIFTSTGKGSDIMIPMAIPALGGMILEVTTVFIVPTLYCWWKERKLNLMAKEIPLATSQTSDEK
jgi:Cu(I)/Ag(I) efflux system membrane protein CusA/SilA